MEQKWDLFISHASEDKAAFVKPLADELMGYGVRIWYDEFELKLGDSLSKSIDYGLIHSSFGLVILSQSFFAKQWTDYELRSLLSKNISGQRAILPVWYDVEKSEVQQYSLYLSDIKALSAEMGIPALAFEVVKRVRPDILDSHVRIQMSRKLERQSETYVKKPIKELHDSTQRHKTLPSFLIISCRLIEELFADILETNYIEMVENFANDWDYEREFIVWSAIANAYVSFIRETHCDFGNIAKKKEAFALLLDYSLSGDFDPDTDTYGLLNIQEQLYLIDCYIRNYKHIHEMLDKAREPE